MQHHDGEGENVGSVLRLNDSFLVESEVLQSKHLGMGERGWGGGGGDRRGEEGEGGSGGRGKGEGGGRGKGEEGKGKREQREKDLHVERGNK